METIIFLSGFALPTFVSKTFLCFEDSFWEGYKRIYYRSKSPTSDVMVEKELKHLINIVNNENTALVIGHSLGGWWASNLACCAESKIKKLALWTPLGIASDFPIFKITDKSELFNKKPNLHNIGPDKTLVIYADSDLVVPYHRHALSLANKFQATSIPLSGGHMWQNNHKYGLTILKDWFKFN